MDWLNRVSLPVGQCIFICQHIQIGFGDCPVSRGLGYMDVVEALLPYRNTAKTFLPIFDLEKIFHTSKY
jgi:hypothetical protein